MAMAAAYSSRDIVEDFLRFKLDSSGLRARSDPPGLRRTAAERRHRAAPAASTSSWRCEQAMTSHREDAPEHTQQDPCSDPPRLQVVLRCAVDELERRYLGDLSTQVSVLLLCGGGRAEQRRRLMAVREELFRDGVNWGRIVAMMVLGGALCTEAVQKGGAWHLDDIARWMEESLDSPPLRGWIEDNGGWDAFVELYSDCRPPSSFWSLRTVFGLAVLGAAGIILGALFNQR